MYVSYKRIDKITFGMLSPKMIKKMSTAKVVTPELYDREGYPVDGGLMDIRLGVIDPGLRCKTCAGKLKECHGHFGYIELARPIIHINYAKILMNFLQCTCRECGKVLIAEEERQRLLARIDKYLQKNNVDAFRKAAKLVKIMCRSIKKCPHCKAKQLTIKIEKPTTFFEDTKRLNPIEIRARMEKVPDEDCLLMGLRPEFARPEWMILTVLGIPPVTMRPSITLETGERAEDDLTHKLSDIVRINQRLFENINAGAPEIIIEDLWDLLQYHVTTYFDNEITQVPPARHRSGQPLKTLSERVKSKEGRFRHNLAGKRVNFAARTVISPDPKIGLNEVGIPKEIAMELTIPETINEWNLEWIKAYVKRGPKEYPGANYTLSEDGKRKKITAETQEQILLELTPGQIVERHIVDGDIAVFNRQPSLHRMSIMCHRMRVLPGKSFRLNPAVCNPYNADFDGDEMNLHVPQTHEAMAEAEILMEVQTQIMSPKNGLNVIGCIEDAITGNYLLTRGAKMPKQEAVMLLLSVGVDNSEKFRKFKEMVTGKEIFSALLPKDFNFIGFSKNCRKHKVCEGKKCETDSFIVIKDGDLVSGIIDSNTVGEGNGTLLRDIHRLYDERTAVEIFGKIFRLGIAYLLKRGMTIKTSDADIPGEIQNKVKDYLNNAETEVDKMIADFKTDKLKAGVSMSIEETLERTILQKLNEARNEIGKLIARSAVPGNSSLIMAQCGAKGNILNLAQTAALVGQQALRGKRITKGYKNRTLTLFKQFDLSPAAHGFVRHSYKKGLNPFEFFFHAMTGRDSLMDTALRTPKSGYLYRRLANAMQDLKIEYDFTVRDANNAIVQFTYGDDGVDVSKSDGGTIDVKKIINEVEGVN
ncbi:MAG: DNA-directed RNA polymerase subunit A' [Nanoarchaeota archaeon]|nr:DNA-directed RNA polymerase subunit A' [Nanoarchaeota archaeon]